MLRDNTERIFISGGHKKQGSKKPSPLTMSKNSYMVAGHLNLWNIQDTQSFIKWSWHVSEMQQIASFYKWIA